MHDGRQQPAKEPVHRVLIFPATQGAALREIMRSLESCGAQVQHSFPLVGGLCVNVTPGALAEAVKRHPGLNILPDRRRRLPPVPFRRSELQTPGVTSHTGPFGRIAAPRIAPLALELMEVPAARKQGVDGQGVRVAIIDSGAALGKTAPPGRGLLCTT